jgi:hypothetical protein
MVVLKTPGRAAGAFLVSSKKKPAIRAIFVNNPLETNFLPSCRPVNEQILFSGMLSFLRD